MKDEVRIQYCRFIEKPGEELVVSWRITDLDVLTLCWNVSVSYNTSK